MIFRLLYISRCRIAPDRVPFELGRILAQSRQHNRGQGITSALLHSGSYFAQMLEGPREEVLRLDRRIGRDPRHEAVRRRHEVVAPDRLLAGWPMVLVGEARHLEPRLAELHALDGNAASRLALERLIVELVAPGGRQSADGPPADAT